MARLFGKNKLKALANTVDTESILPFIEYVRDWQADYHTGTLRTDNETAREQAYNQTFFKDILGYAEKPGDPYSFQPKASTEQRGIPDAIIGHFETEAGHQNYSAVVELKGAGINLDRPQRGEANLSPVQQGFRYKTMYRSVPFVIVSNFWEFRLYNDNQLDYEVWTLDDLADPADDYLAFKTWYVLLQKANFTAPHGQSLTEQWLSDIRVEQEEVGKKFYKQYKDARLALIGEIQQFNPTVREDLDFVIAKAQKIIDRVIFAAFAEDKGLLPDHTLRRLKQGVEDSRTGRRLWSALQDFFFAIDQGDPRLDIPEGYNGGLFAHDDELNRLVLGHDALARVVNLSNYNFDEELSVTILGHIFEQSITDIEELKASGDTDVATTGASRNRRKKDGIFYTPDYIVRYIVENSLGVYLREHEERFLTEAGLHEGIQDATYTRREHQAYVRYYEFLRGIKVVDPACGSGAFLVYVFDYLLAEHQRVGTILGYASGAADFDQVYRTILRNNIYGVDLNEESVEIAKLSLWLKTAVKGKKLTALDQNIKVGNSLIDDPEVAGDKAFNWQEQFPEVFERGGFDVVVGNPPYGAKISASEREHILDKASYQVLTPTLSDTYFAFYVHSLELLLRNKGLLGFISPNTWRLIAAAENFRKAILGSKTFRTTLINQHLEKVFLDATVNCDTVVIAKQGTDPEHKILCRVTLKDEIIAEHEVPAEILANQEYVNPALTKADYDLKSKIDSKSLRLDELFVVRNGVKPYEVGKGTPPQTREIVTSKPFTAESKIDSSFTPLIGGSSFHRYRLLWDDDYWIQYGEWIAAPRDPAIFTAPEKLIFRQTSDRILGTLLGSGYVIRNNTHIVLQSDEREMNFRYALGCLNSKLTNWFYGTINPERGEALAEVKAFHLSQLPIPSANQEQQSIIGKSVDEMLKTNNLLVSKNRQFEKLIGATFALNRWPSRLNRWWTLDFAEFVKALRVKLTLSQKDELLPVFEKYRDELAALDAEIQRLDREIDQLVYQLYDLTPEEIALVEASV